jgi:hypothetical protein
MVGHHFGQHSAVLKKEGDFAVLNDYQKMWEEANPNIEVSDYYKNTIKRRFFQAAFFQAYRSTTFASVG